MPYSSKEKRNQHRLENKDRYNKQARANYEKRKEIRQQQAVEQYHKKEKQNRIRIRNELFELLGGKICVRCGFTDERALQFDHINGNGAVEERKLGMCRNESFHRKYLKDPKLAKKTLQVLCANCNWIKRAENKEYYKKIKKEI